MRIQTQTALLFTLLAATVILLLNGIMYYTASIDTASDFKKRLELRVIVASKIYFEKDTTSSATYNELRQQYLEVLPEEREFIFPATLPIDSIKTPKGLDVPVSYLGEVLRTNETVYYKKSEKHYAGIHYQVGDDTYIIIKSAVNRFGLQALTNLRKILAGAFVAKVVLVFAISFYFSRKTFKPFRDIINRVNSIGVENLSLRLAEKKGKDEIAELTSTFNGMLDRLQTAFDIQNNFVSNASHELKTPLTTIIGEAEIVLAKERDAAAYRQSLEVILKEAEKLEALTSALLSLAQSGFNNNKVSLEIVRIDELLFDIHATIHRIHPESQVHLQWDDLPADENQLVLHANPQLLKLAISNIILNACKYSNNEVVEVKLSSRDNKIIIRITDSGIGIPTEELKHVFVPFFRASNTGSCKGYGVGHPLSLNIIRQHKGNIHVSSAEGQGTTVTVELPLQ
jgi:signal transduction histidine kinase